jgi:putative ABC transport system substrate-binding protein
MAAKQATTAVPIVMAIIGDPVATGVVANLARPEANITGSAYFNPELAAKRLELFKEALVGAKRVAVLVNPDNLGGMRNFKAMQEAAASRQLELRLFEVRGERDIESAFTAMAKTRLDGVLTTDDSVLITSAATVAKLAKQARLPLVGFTELADAGGLISYGVNRGELYRRAAYFVDRIIKGSKPADLPIEQAMRFEIVVNMKTAKDFGLTIPQSILVRADRVIE